MISCFCFFFPGRETQDKTQTILLYHTTTTTTSVVGCQWLDMRRQTRHRMMRSGDGMTRGQQDRRTSLEAEDQSPTTTGESFGYRVPPDHRIRVSDPVTRFSCSHLTRGAAAAELLGLRLHTSLCLSVCLCLVNRIECCIWFMRVLSCLVCNRIGCEWDSNVMPDVTPW